MKGACFTYKPIILPTYERCPLWYVLNNMRLLSSATCISYDIARLRGSRLIGTLFAYNL